jgi:hypothetical protein
MRLDGRMPAWKRWLFLPFGMSIGLVLVTLAVPFITIVGLGTLAGRWRESRRERRFVRAMKGRRRYMSWAEVEQRLHAGEGTLVIEQTHTKPVRAWWTSEDVARQAPAEPPAEEELDWLGIFPPHPFVAWCSHRYLHPELGAAALTQTPPTTDSGFVRSESLRRMFPEARIVLCPRLM